MVVRNINGTAAKNCNCGSWIRHWEKYTRGSANQCRASGCGRSDIVGAHVIKPHSTDDRTYIVPFCRGHNNQSGNITLNATAQMAPANKQNTCA